MKGPTDPKYINATDEGKIRYFFTWLSEVWPAAGPFPSQREIDEIVKESLLEWERIKSMNPSLNVDDFISQLSQIFLINLLFGETNLGASPFSNN